MTIEAPKRGESLPMEVYNCRLPKCWIQTLKSVGLRTRVGTSGLVREALVEWAERRNIELEGW